ncbi:MAG: hypothetical protein Q4C82_04885 [Eubacteriales bacterium]|nr:hypothetical protein [Eubacteriales bacterium]
MKWRYLKSAVCSLLCTALVFSCIKGYGVYKEREWLKGQTFFLHSDQGQWYSYNLLEGMKPIQLPEGVLDGSLLKNGETYVGLYKQGEQVSIVEVDCAAQTMETVVCAEQLQAWHWTTEKIGTFQYQPGTDDISFQYKGKIYLWRRVSGELVQLGVDVAWAPCVEDRFAPRYTWLNENEVCYSETEGGQDLWVYYMDTGNVQKWKNEGLSIYCEDGTGNEIWTIKAERSEFLVYILSYGLYFYDAAEQKNTFVTRFWKYMFGGIKDGQWLAAAYDINDQYCEIMVGNKTGELFSFIPSELEDIEGKIDEITW